MKKRFGTYIAAWAILLALFNVLAFIPSIGKGDTKFTASFWIGYVLITVAFLGQLFCAFIALNKKKPEEVFLNLPLITVSYSALIVSFIVGGLCMLITPLPYTAGIIVCAVVLAFFAIAILKAGAAAEIVAEVGQKVKEKTLFVKALTIDAESLLARAKNDEAKIACKKVFEAIRYSDPMSSDSLAGIEGQITMKFAELTESVNAEKENVKSVADELVALIGDRNTRCKLLK